MESSCLVPDEVETRGSTQVVGKPMLWCKPFTSKRGANTKKKLELWPKPLCECCSKVIY